MATYYLQMEGVNLGAAIYDTNNISVIRGASFLLRKAAKSLTAHYSELKEISVGASVGLFSFEAENETAAKTLQQAIAKYLTEHKKYQFFNFVMSIQNQTADFNQDREKLLARNRFQQMQQLSLVMPPKVENKVICELTNLLPATTTAGYQGEKQQPVADSVKTRLEYGRDQKQDFYQQETRQKTDFKFTKSLTELAERTHDEIPPNLANKIAVLYLDGNRFGKLQQDYCQTPEKLTAFDEDVQGKRRDFLTELINTFKNDVLCLNHNEMRLETLLWGGDEILFVVPAWKGLHLLQLFYQYSQTWTFEKQPLTHAGGLVFCRAKTPIRRIRFFAEELAEVAKNCDRENNLFDYMVLESIGYPASKPDDLRAQIFSVPQAENVLLKDYRPLSPFSGHQLEILNKLKENIPKSQAYAIVRAIIQDNRHATADAFKKKRERLKAVLGNKDTDQKIDDWLAAAFPNQTPSWQWLHLVELWDYILPI